MITNTPECTVCLTAQSLNSCRKIKGKREVEEESEADPSNDDREARDMVSMGWRVMPSFSTMDSIVCTQLAVAQQAGPPAKGLFHLLRSNRMWQPIWTGEMSWAPKKRNRDNWDVLFKKIWNQPRPCEAGDKIQRANGIASVLSEIHVVLLVGVSIACRWLSARNWLMSKQHYSQTKELCNTPPGSGSDNALMEGVFYSALNWSKAYHQEQWRTGHFVNLSKGEWGWKCLYVISLCWGRR